MTPAPTQSNIMAQMRAFLTAVLPSGVAVVAGQTNRVPEIAAANFVVMTAIRQERIETNVDSYADAKLTGSIAGTVMTISGVNPRFPGKIGIGSIIFGVGVAAGTQVVAGPGSGQGGVGTYTVAPAQTISSRTLSAGAAQIQQATKITLQLDFHSADLSTAGDMAQTVTTLMRDGFAYDQFANQLPDYGVRPLYADDARQMPFNNEQQQIEWRWVVEALLQANVIVSVPQQFADAVDVGIISVDARYPP